MALDSCLLEIHSARLYFTPPSQSWRPPIPPSLPQWAGPRPLPINPAPSYRPLLGAEAGPAIEASPVAIGVVTTVDGLEHFCSPFSAIWTTHRVFLLSVDAEPHPTLKALGWPIAISRGNLAVLVKILLLLLGRFSELMQFRLTINATSSTFEVW